MPPNEVLEAARGCTPRFNGKKQEGSRPSPYFDWGLTPDAIRLQLPARRLHSPARHRKT